MNIKYKVIVHDSILLLITFMCGLVGVYLALNELSFFNICLLAGFVQFIKSITELFKYEKKTTGEVAYRVEIVDINNSKIGLSNFAKFIIELMKILALLNVYNNYISLLAFILFQFPFNVSKDNNEWSTMFLYVFQKKYFIKEKSY